MADRDLSLAPYRRSVADARQALVPAEAECRRLGAEAARAVASLADAEASLESREAVLRGQLLRTAPPVLARLQDALLQAHQHRLQGPRREQTLVVRDAAGNFLLDDEGNVRRQTFSSDDETARRLAELLAGYRECRDQLPFADEATLNTRMRALAGLVDIDLDDDTVGG
jgi:hypothetical protein